MLTKEQTVRALRAVLASDNPKAALRVLLSDVEESDRRQRSEFLSRREFDRYRIEQVLASHPELDDSERAFALGMTFADAEQWLKTRLPGARRSMA